MPQMHFGDNGSQLYFENEKYLLLNPYVEEDGQRRGSGWVWFRRSQPGQWGCLEDPEAPHSIVGGRTLAEAVAYAEHVTGERFELLGAPQGLGPSRLIGEEMPPPTPATCWAAVIGKCTCRPPCEEGCQFYKAVDRDFQIRMTVSDFRSGRSQQQ